jgi:hypothetical protein
VGDDAEQAVHVEWLCEVGHVWRELGSDGPGEVVEMQDGEAGEAAARLVY